MRLQVYATKPGQKNFKQKFAFQKQNNTIKKEQLLLFFLYWFVLILRAKNYLKFCNKEIMFVAGEMVWQLRALVALSEDSGFISSTPMIAQLSVIPVSGDPVPSSDFWGLIYSHGRHAYTQTHTHIKEINLQFVFCDYAYMGTLCLCLFLILLFWKMFRIQLLFPYNIILWVYNIFHGVRQFKYTIVPASHRF